MHQTSQNPTVLLICYVEALLSQLQDANQKLDQIVKELGNYLEKKREKFARFYFLSNDDLLGIVS
jgi:dynein heavy chain